jgi:putative ABC transport system permease protein
MWVKFLKKTPLAWHQLMKEKGRFAVAIAGITFADVLMFFQLGQLDSLFDGATLVQREMAKQSDIAIINAEVRTVTDLDLFPRERLQQALSYSEVESVTSVYAGTATWINPVTRQRRAIAVWGIDPDNPPFELPGLTSHLGQLKLLNNILFDRISRPEYGPIAELLDKPGALEAQINGQLMRTVGTFQLGVSFSADGNIITSDSTFLKMFRGHPSDRIEIGLVKLKAGSDVQAIVKVLRRDLPTDVKILHIPEWIDEEKAYWETQGLGFIFLTGVVVGFAVGTVIVYQILHSNVVDHLPEYATLKAMGYSDRFLFQMLIQQVLLLALLGFLPGLLGSIGIYHLTYIMTLTPITMKTERAILVLVLTVIMCGISGVISMRKLQSADPADIF